MRHPLSRNFFVLLMSSADLGGRLSRLYRPIVDSRGDGRTLKLENMEEGRWEKC